MSNVDEVRWRLLREQVTEVLRQVSDRRSAALSGAAPADEQDEILLRLAATAVALLESHPLNEKGHCRMRGCTRRRWLPWRRRRTCPIFGTVHFCLSQPVWIVEKAARSW